VVIVQDDRFDATASVTACPLTTNPTEAPLTRIQVEPSSLHGLDEPSCIMVDKVTTILSVWRVEGRSPARRTQNVRTVCARRATVPRC